MQDPAAALMGMGPQFPEHEPLKCPRCDSTNTKFCYYNNYNLSQPRHFCKNCRRYWTRGGTLRNIPFGGTTRKRNTKRPDSDHHPAPSRVKTSAELSLAGNLDGSGLKRMELGGDMKSGQVPDGVGSTSNSFCWRSDNNNNNSNNGWPHLANTNIYTPGSSFP